MKIDSILLIVVCVTLASCFSSKTTRYNRVYKMQDYGTIESIKKDQPFSLRYHVTNVALDIWSDDSVHYYGRTICYTVRHTKNGYRYYGMNSHVSDSLVNKILYGFRILEIAEILRKDSFQTHVTCDDCGIEEYEYSDGRNYVRKAYFSPNARNTIDSFSNFITKNFDFDKRFYEFIDHLPKGIYQRNMIEVIKD